MILCLIDEHGRTLKDKSISDLSVKFMKEKGVSKVTNISGGRVNSPSELHVLLNGQECDVIFISDNNPPYLLGDEQKQKLLPLLSGEESELSGKIIKRFLLDNGVSQMVTI